MTKFSELVEHRRSSRVPFDTSRAIPTGDLQQVLNAARWAPTAHNMQNFELIAIDDPQLLKAIGELPSGFSEVFARENYEHLAFSEDELRRKKVGILAAQFPPFMRQPPFKPDPNDPALKENRFGQLIAATSVLLIVLYNPTTRAPASEGDFLGHVSLGCVMQNMWLAAADVGIGFHVVSSLAAPPMEGQLRKLLGFPEPHKIAFTVRLGYPVMPANQVRVRRDVEGFVHRNKWGAK
jgi:nitroreductase